MQAAELDRISRDHKQQSVHLNRAQAKQLLQQQELQLHETQLNQQQQNVQSLLDEARHLDSHAEAENAKLKAHFEEQQQRLAELESELASRAIALDGRQQTLDVQLQEQQTALSSRAATLEEQLQENRQVACNHCEI